jgi:hypothetical protein
MLSMRILFGLCSIAISAGMAMSCEASDDGQEVQASSRDSIVATVTGNLRVTWNPGVVYYASVSAGGTEIELDPAGCPDVTRELLEHMNTQGGGLITAVQAEAKGSLVFEKRPQTIKHRGIGWEDIDAVVPVLRVQTIKITTLPAGHDSGPLKRDRDTVKSTTMRRTKP